MLFDKKLGEMTDSVYVSIYVLSTYFYIEWIGIIMP